MRRRPQRPIWSSKFTADGPNRLWVADITYIPTGAGFLCLAVVLDAWSRRVVGCLMEVHLRTELILAAMDMAVAQRQPTDVFITPTTAVNTRPRRRRRPACLAASPSRRPNSRKRWEPRRDAGGTNTGEQGTSYFGVFRTACGVDTS